MLLIFSTTLFAQKNITKFLGIPVDGTKSEMIKRLKEKGFKEHPFRDEFLIGEFNGEDASISIKTNNGKVWRIAVLFDYSTTDESQIKIRFNNLCYQFSKNKKYHSFDDISKYEIPEDENILYEMTINHKVYDANFIQMDQDLIVKELVSFSSKYTDEQMKNPSEELIAEFNNVQNGIYEKLSNSLVWFRLLKNGNSLFSIVLFYDNLYNQAHGEDL